MSILRPRGYRLKIFRGPLPAASTHLRQVSAHSALHSHLQAIHQRLRPSNTPSGGTARIATFESAEWKVPEKSLERGVGMDRTEQGCSPRRLASRGGGEAPEKDPTTGVETQFIHVEEVKHLGGCRLWLHFNDGSTGEIDLSSELTGPIFYPLKDEKEFSKVHVEGGTIEWENGADFAPEFLRDKLAEQIA